MRIPPVRGLGQAADDPRFYTYRDDVPGASLGFMPGRGYYSRMPAEGGPVGATAAQHAATGVGRYQDAIMAMLRQDAAARAGRVPPFAHIRRRGVQLDPAAPNAYPRTAHSIVEDDAAYGYDEGHLNLDFVTPRSRLLRLLAE